MTPAVSIGAGVALGAIAGLALALAGCGGSDSEDRDTRPRSAPSSSSPSQSDASAEFVQRVDALCKDTNPELAAIQSALTRTRDAARAGRASLPETFGRFATLLRRARTITDRFRTRLRAIGPPKGEAAFHRALISSTEEGYVNLGRQQAAAEAQDAVRLRQLSVDGSVINAKGKGLTTGHGGFRFCGRR